MKKNNIQSFIYPIALTLWLVFGCTDLDVSVESEITSENFPKTEEDFIAVASSAYSSFTYKRFSYYWLSQELTTDAMIITANGGNWYDAARSKQPHMHTYDKDNRVVRYTWNYGFSGISTCNRVLDIVRNAEESDLKSTILGEVKCIRALYYYWMMDLYGAIPLVSSFGEEAGERTSRADVVEFIENELLEVLEDLNTTVDETTYGRPTKWMAYALLAKLYLNAEIYTSVSRWNDVVTMCDYVITEAIDNGTFSLDEDYLGMFDINNGSQITDFIFAIPFDCNYITEQYFARWWLHPLLRDKYELTYTPSGSARTLPEYYAKFNDPTDVRNQIWLTGKQYFDDGSPIMVETTKKGYDNRYTGTDANDPITVQLELTPEVEFRDLESFDTGDDLVGRSVGYRCNKFYPDKNSTTRAQSNDFPIFRYADVLLMKAEAILRGGSATKGQTALTLVNMVRERANASLFTEIDLNELLDERARELCHEFWRRNDLIRFGRFEDTWGVKTDNDVNHRIFPIPATEIDLNPSLEQNPGYE